MLPCVPWRALNQVTSLLAGVKVWPRAYLTACPSLLHGWALSTDHLVAAQVFRDALPSSTA